MAARKTVRAMSPSARTQDVATARDGMTVISPGTVYYRVGGREYPMRSNIRCNVCTHDRRVDIENGIIQGFGHKAVAKLIIPVPPDGAPEEELTQYQVAVKRLTLSIDHHISGGHLPIDHTIRRVALEERTRELGVIAAERDGTLVDDIGLLKEVQRRTYERIAMGEIEPEVKDGVAAAKITAAFRLIDANTDDDDIMRQALIHMMDSLQRLLPPELFDAALKDFRGDPLLRGLDERRKAIRRGQAIEAVSAE
jgi:hypothetical protein